MLLDRYQAALAERGVSPRTQGVYVSRAKAYLRWTESRDNRRAPAWPTAAALAGYETYLRDEAESTAWTINSYLRAAKDFINTLSDHTVDLDARTAPALTTRILTATESQALTDALPGLSPRDLIMVLLLWDLAATPNTVTGLRVDNITLPTQTDTSPDAGGKAGSVPWLRLPAIASNGSVIETTVAAPPRLAAALLEHLPRRRGGYGHRRPLLAADSPELAPGGVLSNRDVRDIIAEIGTTAGISGLTPMILRRTALASTLTDTISDTSNFTLLARVHPKHAARLRKSIATQIADHTTQTWTELATHPTSAGAAKVSRRLSDGIAQQWTAVINDTWPAQVAAGIQARAAEQRDTELSNQLLQLLAPALHTIRPLTPAAGWLDHLQHWRQNLHEILTQIYRHHLTHPLLGLPASLSALLVATTNPERLPTFDDHPAVAVALNDLAVIGQNPTVGSQAPLARQPAPATDPAAETGQKTSDDAPREPHNDPPRTDQQR